MPREHVEFVQSQALAWQTDATSAPYAGVTVKLFSDDPSSGARSCIVRYPAGWQHGGTYALLADEEFYVLDGSLSINGRIYLAGDYAYLPAGFERNAAHSDSGCDVLTFFEASAGIADQGQAAFDSSHLIEHLATREMAWGSASDPKVASVSVGRKLLRPDTDSGERTWLLRLETNEPYELNGVEEHTCVEEMFLLDGDISMVTGVLRAGAYFWRPPAIQHGPMGTSNGFLALFRAKEGPFTTSWTTPVRPIPWNAEYAPVLPDSMRRRITPVAFTAERY